jgi:hypothetical protein
MRNMGRYSDTRYSLDVFEFALVFLIVCMHPLFAASKKPARPPIPIKVQVKQSTSQASTEDKTSEVSPAVVPEPAKVVEKPVEMKPDIVFKNFNDGLGKWKIEGNSITESVWKNPDLFPNAPYKGELVGIEDKGYPNALKNMSILPHIIRELL